MTESSHSLSSPAAPLCSLLSSLFSPFLSVFLSPCSLLQLRGKSNERLLCSDWMIYLVIRWEERDHNSKVSHGRRGERREKKKGKGEKRGLLKCFDKRLWKGKDRECYHCVHVRVGRSFTDVSTLAQFLREIMLQISSLLAPCASPRKTGRLRSALGRSLGSLVWGYGRGLVEGELMDGLQSSRDHILNFFVRVSSSFWSLQGRRSVGSLTGLHKYSLSLQPLSFFQITSQ